MVRPEKLEDRPYSFLPVDSPAALSGKPVFRLARSEHSVFYAPGMVAVAARPWDKTLQRLLAGKPGGAVPPIVTELKDKLIFAADKAAEGRRRIIDNAYEPESLHICLHNLCHMSCGYCLRDKAGPVPEPLRPETTLVAGRIVAAVCRRKKLPFSVIFHGWGEPTFAEALFRSHVQAVERILAESGLRPARYLATNGIISERLARFIGRHFESVGLSCDGPEDIQEEQRPLVDKKKKSGRFLKRTASILKGNGIRLLVRATITPDAMRRQEEIADYILHELRPDEVHFEPAYRSPDHRFEPDDADPFAAHFFKAKRLALSQGVEMVFSGTRLNTIHGPYCYVLNQVLNLGPGQRASACFADARPASSGRFIIGERRGKRFVILRKKIQEMKTGLATLPDPCQSCFNMCHCAGLCPDQCGLEAGITAGTDMMRAFRCRLQKTLAFRTILGLAEELINKNKDLPFTAAWREVTSIGLP